MDTVQLSVEQKAALAAWEQMEKSYNQSEESEDSSDASWIDGLEEFKVTKSCHRVAFYILVDRLSPCQEYWTLRNF